MTKSTKKTLYYVLLSIVVTALFCYGVYRYTNYEVGPARTIGKQVAKVVEETSTLVTQKKEELTNSGDSLTAFRCRVKRACGHLTWTDWATLAFVLIVGGIVGNFLLTWMPFYSRIPAYNKWYCLGGIFMFRGCMMLYQYGFWSGLNETFFRIFSGAQYNFTHSEFFS